MKKFLAAALIFISILNFAQIKWMTLNEAIEAQKIQPKKILIDFYADWCKPCREMDAKTYGNPVIAEMINQNYYPVKFNAEATEAVTIFGRTFTNPDFSEGKKRNSLHDFTKFMNVTSVPSLVFIDEQAMPVTILNGTLTPKELEPYLAIIASNGYQKIRSRGAWDDYQRKFRSKIREKN